MAGRSTCASCAGPLQVMHRLRSRTNFRIPAHDRATEPRRTGRHGRGDPEPRSGSQTVHVDGPHGPAVLSMTSRRDGPREPARVIPVCFPSGSTGLSAGTLGDDLLIQFPDLLFESTLIPSISTIAQAREVVAQLDEAMVGPRLTDRPAGGPRPVRRVDEAFVPPRIPADTWGETVRRTLTACEQAPIISVILNPASEGHRE